MMDPFPPGLSIIHANHLEDLRDVAVEWISRYPVAPLENECFIVQSNGMAQWLKLALASDTGCGIGAGLDFQLPGRFMWQAYRAVLGDKGVPHASPFDRERLIWRLMRLLTQLGDDPVFSVLSRFLSDDADSRKRYQLAFHLAALFDQYQVYRADWLTAWQKGRDGLFTGRGEWLDLPGEQAWQAALWRRIHEDIPFEFRHTGRADLHGRFLTAAMEAMAPLTGLPRRIIVFGICSLPGQVLEALDFLSRHCQILLFVHNPCRHYWADIIEDRDLFRIEQARHARAGNMPEDLDPDALHQHVNPLLAAWGKQGRDYIGLLYRYDQPETYRERFSQIDLFRDFAPPDSDEQGTLLVQVQQAILDLTAVPGLPEDKQMISPEDRSIQFHSAHSRQREVEILQDQLLNFFEEIPDLRPRDIIVMTPDINAYTCHIQAVFGNIPPTDERFIPFSIADGPDKVFRPLLTALDTLLNLPHLRMTTADVMALLEVPALGRRFNLAPSDLPLIKQWMQGAGICWGLNSSHRSAFDLPPDLEQNTWQFGLRRMLLGYAVGKGFSWNGIEPYDEIGGLSAALVGGLADFLDALEQLWQRFKTPAPPSVWCLRLRKMVETFFLPEESHDRLFFSHVADVLVAWETACTSADFQGDLDLPVVRDHIMAAMTDASASQRFLAGMVNFCTLMPMRAIPFKVVCLLGMNDGEYPRSRVAMDFDLMAVKGLYRPGDRSRREDDRYLFLEALLSARKTLYISYIGHNVTDNTLKAPSVLVAQLRDYLSAGWQFHRKGDFSPAGPLSQVPESDVAQKLTLEHPLQPFSKRYFDKNGNNALFTYAREWREIFEPHPLMAPSAPAAVDSNTESRDEEEMLSPLPDPLEALQLRPLIQFMKNPPTSFFQQRLGVYFDDVDPSPAEEEPFALEGLTPYILKNELLNAGLATVPTQRKTALDTAGHRLLHTGQLPMEGFGQLAMTSLTEPVEAMMAFHETLSTTWPHEVSNRDMALFLTRGPLQGKQIEGVLDHLHAIGNVSPDGGGPTGITPSEKGASTVVAPLARWEFYPHAIMDAKGKPGRLPPLVGLWVTHVMGCAVGVSLASSLVAPDGVVTLEPLEKNRAEALLHEMVALWWQGLCSPLPITPRTAMAWLSSLPAPEEETAGGEGSQGEMEKARAAASKVYQGDGFRPGEVDYTPGALRAYPDFDTLWQAHGNAFPLLAQRLYAPLFEALNLDDSAP